MTDDERARLVDKHDDAKAIKRITKAHERDESSYYEYRPDSVPDVHVHRGELLAILSRQKRAVRLETLREVFALWRFDEVLDMIDATEKEATP